MRLQLDLHNQFTCLEKVLHATARNSALGMLSKELTVLRPTDGYQAESFRHQCMVLAESEPWAKGESSSNYVVLISRIFVKA